MILPTKHISIARSLLNVGAMLLQQLNRPKTVAGLWDEVRELEDVGTFQRFVLALDFLYILGAIELKDGLLTSSGLVRQTSPVGRRTVRRSHASELVN